MFSKFDLIQILKQGHVYCRLMYIVLQIFSNRFVCLWLDNLNLAYFVTCNLFCHTPSIQFHVNSWKSGQTFCMFFFLYFTISILNLIRSWFRTEHMHVLCAIPQCGVGLLVLCFTPLSTPVIVLHIVHTSLPNAWKSSFAIWILTFFFLNRLRDLGWSLMKSSIGADIHSQRNHPLPILHQTKTCPLPINRVPLHCTVLLPDHG